MGDPLLKKTVQLDAAETPDGKSMTLHEHDGTYVIRIDQKELMSSRHHNSEEVIAELACAHILHKKGARVLIGGLGLGFTLRKTLACLGSDALVTVAEIMAAVVKWNQNPAYGLGHDALADRRTKIYEGDVAYLLARSTKAFDSIILDIDNGTSAMSAESNRDLYQETGLQIARAALKPGGCLAVWSASDDPPFKKRMSRAGFTVSAERAAQHKNGGGWHHLFIGRIS